MKSVVLFAALVCVSFGFPEFTVDVVRKELSAFGSGNVEPNVVELARTLNLNTLVQLITKAGLTETFTGTDRLTIFGPSDDAFAKLSVGVREAIEKDVNFLTDVLRYHVINDEIYSSKLKNELLVPSLLESTYVRINVYDKLVPELVAATGSPITKPDNVASNGVIHVLDRVMFPIPLNDILTLVSSNDNFSTLLKAIEVSGLIDSLKGGPYTLFAPTNKAFEKLPPGELDGLLADKDKLRKILSQHLVNGTLFSAALKRVDKVTTRENDVVTVGMSSTGDLTVNKANVIIADAAATNGVLHVIDTVILPPNVVAKITTNY